MRARFSRRWGRGIALYFCKLFSHARELFIRARDLFVDVRESFIGARDEGIVGFNWFRSGCGVHWRFPFSVQCHPKAAVDYPSGRPAANALRSLVERMAV